MKTVVVLVGSLASNSINLRLAKALQALADSRLKFDFLDLGTLPHYNDDLWAAPPAAVTDLKRRIEAAEGVLIVMPEHNRSFPAVLKNAIDWGSRPWGHNSWTGKPLAIAGASPGAIGTAAGQAHLRSLLPALGFVVMGQPEVYLHAQPGLIDEHGEIADDQTRGFLTGFVDRFVDWIETHGAPRPAESVAAE
ncbi:NADPH-dependent FMN reductase [Devosia nitrariae]|uniref:FMN reductase n=1 Tax=Devosia nitrariae TaxID=2071872 RepID=A0ABQ5W4S5_9HYPH|nr:NAD(P)H-dependent oxidoreductase [Devosia nitrariae]GLQ54640.1 FMN reductase [Devosia nitrariae]